VTRRQLSGIGVSPGVAIGPALVVHWGLPKVPERAIAESETGREIARLHDAIAAVAANLTELRRRAEQRVGPDEAKIFDAQLLMLRDEDFTRGVERLIHDNQLSAEQAFEFKALEVRALWAQSSSERLRQRIADLSGIAIRILYQLLGQPIETLFERVGKDPVIVFARELAPGLTLQFDREHVAGFASEEGTRTSHAAILARSLGIPCVMGVFGGMTAISPGAPVLLDGTHGTLVLHPTSDEIREARGQERRRHALERALEKGIGQTAITLDGTSVTLRGNVDLPEELEPAAQHGAEGVGLVRTEFLLMGRTELPTEEEQLRFFEKVARRFPGHPIIIRSYDLGGDKFPAPFRPPPEANPFLGWRAIRVCLDQPELFRTQIRAVLRARLHGDVQLMLPLITGLEEVERTRELVREAAVELARQGIPAADYVPIGVMIETPAAAILAEQLAARSDFVSVGSNDLTQYTLAVDRGNARLADRFTPFHPAVIRSLHHIWDSCRRVGLPLSVCGEMASEPVAVFLLLALGYRVFSIAPPALPLIRWLVRQIDLDRARQVGDRVLAASTMADVVHAVEGGLSEHVNLKLLDAGRLPKSRRQASFTP